MTTRKAAPVLAGVMVALVPALGCERKVEDESPAAARTASPRQESADHLASLASDPAYFQDATERVQAFISRLKTDEQIPPTIVAAWYAHGREQSKLELVFYDESQAIRGFRIQGKKDGEPAVYDYVIYLEQSRNNRPLGIVSVEVLPEQPPGLGPRAEVPIQKVPGGTIRTWVPAPVRSSPATICLLDADGREHGCTSLGERPARPNTQPATKSY